jgi:DNA-binding NtrC family response regulator
MNTDNTKRKILVIDGEDDVRSTLQRYIQLLGHHALVSRSAEEGLQILSGNMPDLILLGMRLPGMDGMATLKTLHEKYEHLQVVMLAAAADIPKANIALNCGAGDFITKPLDLPTVTRTLQIHLRTGR